MSNEKLDQAVGETKKGNATWKPAPKLKVKNKEAGYRYRWLNKEGHNVDTKLEEGWELVSKLHGKQPEHEAGTTGMTSNLEYRDMILARMTEELAVARNAFFQKETDTKTRELGDKFRSNLKNSQGPSAKDYGKVIID